MRVVNHTIKGGEVLKVVALAGKQWLLYYCMYAPFAAKSVLKDYIIIYRYREDYYPHTIF